MIGHSTVPPWCAIRHELSIQFAACERGVCRSAPSAYGEPPAHAEPAFLNHSPFPAHLIVLHANESLLEEQDK